MMIRNLVFIRFYPVAKLSIDFQMPHILSPHHAIASILFFQINFLNFFFHISFQSTLWSPSLSSAIYFKSGASLYMLPSFLLSKSQYHRTVLAFSTISIDPFLLNISTDSFVFNLSIKHSSIHHSHHSSSSSSKNPSFTFFRSHVSLP